MSILKRGLAALFLASGLVAAAPAQAQAAATQPIFGTWRNPSGSVHLEIRPCGANACGYVVWASPKAQADARKGSGANLIGLQLFRDMAQDQDGAWRGRVFVPDLNMTLSGGARVADAGHLRARGCLVGRVLCKSQTWTRLDGPSA